MGEEVLGGRISFRLVQKFYKQTEDLDGYRDFKTKYKNSLAATECHWSDTKEGHSCLQGKWNAIVGKDAYENRQSICAPFCSDDTNERGLRHFEFVTINDLVFAYTFGHHEASRRWTWHSPNRQHHKQIDYMLVRKRFRSGVKIARTWIFPKADIGSDHDLLIMTFHLRLKRIGKPKHTRLKIDLECVGNLPSHNRQEVWTYHHHE